MRTINILKSAIVMSDHKEDEARHLFANQNSNENQPTFVRRVGGVGYLYIHLILLYFFNGNEFMEESFVKEVSIDTMDEKDKKAIQTLQRLGYSHATAKILVYMSIKGKARSRDIEKSTGLRQPEVSIWVRQLMKAGVLSRSELHTPGKGRPTHRYALKKPMSKVLTDIGKETETRIDVIRENLNELKNLLGDRSGSRV